MITLIPQEDISKVVSFLDKNTEAAPAELKAAIKTLNMSTDNSKDDDKLVASLMALYFTRNLTASGYVR